MNRRELLRRYQPPSLRDLPGDQDELEAVNSLEEYSYGTLPNTTSIRLLELDTLPSLGSTSEVDHQELLLKNAVFSMSIPRCKMVVVDLEAKPKYDALSYTWGNPFSQVTPESKLESFDQTPRYPIVCNGKRLVITGNLYAFLNRIKIVSPDERGSGVNKVAGSARSTYVWIDSIAINQRDKKEKSEQIRLMQRIYKQANLVLVWLGPADSHTEPMMEPLQWIAQAPLEKAHLGEPHTLWDAEAITRAQWICVFALFDRAWFKRAWVAQEAVLASQMVFMIGLLSLPWEILVLVAQWLHRSGFATKLAAAPELRQVDEMAWILGMQFEYTRQTGFSFKQWRRGPRGGMRPWQESWVVPGGDVIRMMEARAILGDGEELSLPWLLDYFRRTQATDDRDKVYAFLGLRSFHDEQLAPVTPDYTQTTSHIYCDAAWATMKITDDLTILSKVEDQSFRSTSDLPSWVPDYKVANFPFSFLGEHAMKAFPRWDASSPQGLQVTPIKATTLDDNHGLLSPKDTCKHTISKSWRWITRKVRPYRKSQNIVSDPDSTSTGEMAVVEEALSYSHSVVQIPSRSHEPRTLAIQGYFLDEIVAVAESDFEKSGHERSPEPNFIDAARIALETPSC